MSSDAPPPNPSERPVPRQLRLFGVATSAESWVILDRAIEEHQPSHVFGLFSGGNDSLCAGHLLSQHPAFTAMAHIDTTISVPDARVFVNETCKHHGWPLKVYRGPRSYRDLILEYGFPGPGSHAYMYSWLKERAVRQLVREHKVGRNGRVMLVTGVRLSESKRRMGHVKPVVREGAQVWVAPILYWDDDDKDDYIAQHSLRTSPVAKNLCMSGECLCGAFAEPNELAAIAAFYPEVAAEIRSLMAEAEQAGVHSQWGERPPRRAQHLCGQCDLAFWKEVA